MLHAARINLDVSKISETITLNVFQVVRDPPLGIGRMEAITSGKYSDILITVHCWKTKQAKEVDKKEEAAHQKHESKINSSSLLHLHR